MNPREPDSAHLSRPNGQRPGLRIADVVRDRTPGLLKLLRPLRQNKWKLLVGALISAAVGFFVTTMLTPTFRSTVTLLIETGRSNVLSVPELYSDGVGNREKFQTQAEQLKSREVALRTVRKLNLSDHPLFDLRQRPEPLVSRVSRYWGIQPEAHSKETIEAYAINRLTDNLSVAPLRGSQLIKVSVDSPDRTLAADIASSLADSYIQADLDARDQMAQAASLWLNARLVELRRRLESSEELLQEYREKQGLIESPMASQGGNAKQLEELSRQLVDARVRLTAAREAYNQVASGGLKARSASVVLTNSMASRAQLAEGEAQRKLAETGELYGPSHPLYQAAAKDLQIAQAHAQQVVSTVIDSLTKEYQAAQAGVTAIETAITNSRGSLRDINRKEVDMGPLEREVVANRDLYQRFLARVKETDVAADIRSAPARIVDPAVPSLLPVSPDRPRITAIFGIIGLAAGIILVILRDRSGKTLRTTSNVEELIGLPLLAAVPRMDRHQAKHPGRLMLKDPTSLVAESIRTIATCTMLSLVAERQKTILITSAAPWEGKSTISSNLALFYARSKRVLLVDADMRKPSLAVKLGVPANAPGFGDYLAGSLTLDACVHRVEGSTLDLIPAGTAKINPLEMLWSGAIQQLFETVRDKFDIVILDSAPVELVSDALIIGAETAGTIVVARSDETPIPAVLSAVKRLEAAGANLLGVVLNGHDFTKAQVYYGEDSTYAKYGYDKSYGAALPR